MPFDPRSFIVRTVFIVMAALCGWNAARAQTAGIDCSTGHHWFDSFDGDLGTAAVTQADACAAAAGAMGLSDASKATAVPGGCLMDESQWGYGVFLNSVVDYCAPALSGGGGLSAGGSASSPLYVSLLGPLSPASAAGGLSVDGPTVKQAFLWGFAVILTSAFLGIAVGAGVGVIKKG